MWKNLFTRQQFAWDVCLKLRTISQLKIMSAQAKDKKARVRFHPLELVVLVLILDKIPLKQLSSIMRLRPRSHCPPIPLNWHSHAYSIKWVGEQERKYAAYKRNKIPFSNNGSACRIACEGAILNRFSRPSVILQFWTGRLLREDFDGSHHFN